MSLESIFYPTLILAVLVTASFFAYRVFKKFKSGVISLFEYGEGLEPYGPFSDIVLTVAEHINKKRKLHETSTPTFYRNEERWLLESTGLKTFYLIDERQINDFYSQINLSPVLQEITEKEKSTKLLEAGISNTPINIKGNTTGELEKTSKYAIDNSIVTKYGHVENYLKEYELISYGIAPFYSDERKKVLFYNSCDQLQVEHGFEITTEQREKHWIKLNQEYALPFLDEIKHTSGNVAIQETFNIVENEDTFQLIHLHKINDFLPDKEQGVSIVIMANKSNLSQSGKSFFINGKTIKVTCLGKVITWDDETRSLIINPISIFS